MTIERVKDAAKLAKEIVKLNEDGFYGWNGWDLRVQTRHTDLLKLFPEAEITTRDVEEGRDPYEASVVVDGVKFFALLSQEEYDELGRKITDEDRRIMEELIEEERREREEAFWRIGLDPGYNGEEAQDV